MGDIDTSDTDLDLLDKDIPSKHFVCLQRVFNTSSRRLQDMSSRRLQDVFSVAIFRLPERLEDVLEDEKLLH